ncbi:MAG: AbrB/MazE/SpoVT family DNA-binding domain-containing protein [Halobacteriales archaeon]|nr:AbrB/MazE/SpoVT family DNA-binding domain-containing protein [Halobacteriales archaeon]
MADAELDDKGRVVIPVPIRRELGLGPGQKLDVSVVEGRIVLSRKRTQAEVLARLKGIMGKGPRAERLDPLRVKDMWTEKLPEPPRRRRARR